MRPTGILTNNFYSQSLVNWSCGLISYNNNSSFNFYYSGRNGLEKIFGLNNGKIYSPDNYLVGGYVSNQTVVLSGNLSTSSIDLYQGGVPLYLGASRRSVGNVSSVVISGDALSGVDFLNLKILGQVPNVYIPGDNSIIPIYPNQPLAFGIQNNSDQAFTILNAYTTNTNFLISGSENLNVPSGQTSVFYILNIGELAADAQTVPITLNTDHGQQNIKTILSGSLTRNNYVLNVDYSLGTNIASSTSEPYNINVVNYDGAVIGIGMRYVDGITGDVTYNVAATQPVSNVRVSGEIYNGSGYLYGQASGVVAYYNSITSGTEYGYGYGTASEFFVAPDSVISVPYSVLATGMGSVILAKEIDATGTYIGEYSGYVGVAGGALTGYIGSQVYSGGGYDGEDFYYRQLSSPIANISVPFTGILTGYFDSGEYFIQKFISEPIYATGNFSTNLDITGFAFATGGHKSGTLIGDFGFNNYDPGIYTFYKNMSGLGSGYGHRFQEFDVITNKNTKLILTGFLSGDMSHTFISDGYDINFKQSIPLTGVLNEVYVSGESSAFIPSDAFILIDSSGESKYENNLTNTGQFFRRTSISRNGSTEDGTGAFNNVFQNPMFDSPAYTGKRYYGYDPSDFIGWTETLPVDADFHNVNLSSPFLSLISGTFDIIEYTDDYALFSIKTKNTGVNAFSFPVSFNFKTKTAESIMTSKIYQYSPIVSGRKIYLDISSGGYYGLPSNGVQYINSGLDVAINLPRGESFVELSTTKLRQKYSATWVTFSDVYFLGNNTRNSFIFSVERGGYSDYVLTGTIRGKIDDNSKLPFLPSNIVTGGFNWDMRFEKGETKKFYGFDLYPSIYKYNDWSGILSLNVGSPAYTYSSPILPFLVVELNQAYFIMTPDEYKQGSLIIDQKFIRPRESLILDVSNFTSGYLTSY